MSARSPTARQLVRISKFLSRVLRHRPDQIGITVDAHGWALVDELIRKGQAAGVSLTPALITEVVAHSADKQRFALSADGARIRATHGHSIAVDLGLEPVPPPARLFHGTATRFLQSIRKNGLVHRRRQYVHLSPDVETATAVGLRHGVPAILVIDAGTMHAEGYEFLISEHGVWLTGEVPVRYIAFPGD